MNTVAKIACRTIGTAGMGIALYDACRLSKHFAGTGAGAAQTNYMERAYFDARTIDEVSYTSNAIRQKTFDVRTKNPLPGIFGGIKGGVKGFLYGLGNSLPVVAFSALALLGKGWAAKLGAVGIGLGIVYKIFREGYGLGKNNPMT